MHSPGIGNGGRCCGTSPCWGEASAQLAEDVKERFTEVSWAQPAQLRNRIVHGYWSIDLEILHTTATNLLPQFTERLRKALAALEAALD
jgi:uncharacterized protein with HEPN domain